MISRQAERAKGFFGADQAAQYEERARNRRLWEAERGVVESIVGRMPAGWRLLDVPVGTGRFLPLYAQQGLHVTGLDASQHMLKLAAKVGTGAKLRRGDIFAIDEPDASFDVVMAIRILHLIEHADVPLALAQLQRVARRQIVITVRFGDEVHACRGPRRRPALLGALKGWRIDRETVVLDDWHLLELRPC